MSESLDKNIVTRVLLVLTLCILPLILILPVSAADWYKGDLHIHTAYSSIQGYDKNIDTLNDNCPQEMKSKNGKNVSELRNSAISAGIDWITITDHSYCLNQDEWNNLVSECDTSSDSSFLCSADMEFSVKDEKAGTNDEIICDIWPSYGGGESAAHLGAHGIDQFISQSPSNVWCPDSPESQEGIDEINDNEGFAIIHHPVSVAWDWESKNEINNVRGIEIWNGGWYNPEALNALALNWWISLLLKGKKIFAYGGTDAHEGVSTVNYQNVYMDSLTASNLKTALKSGRSVASNNGWIDLSIGDKHMGDMAYVVEGEEITLNIEYDVNSQCYLSVYEGEIKSLEKLHPLSSINGYGNENQDFTITKNSYFRAECFYGDKKIIYNPIWTIVVKQLAITNNEVEAL
jgi:hypothetical protein